MSFQFWYLFPAAVLIATFAMASGIGGATFFAPLFILGLGLPPDVAIGAGLITETFGFASGFFAYARKRLIDYKLGFVLLSVTVPLALAGSWLAGYVEADLLKLILGFGLTALAISFLRTPDPEDVQMMDTFIYSRYGGEQAETELVTAQGESIRYKVCNRLEGMIISGIGGLFEGLISSGLGEMNGFFLLQRCKVPSKVSVATSVFVVAVTALSAALGHLFRFVQAGPETISTVLDLVIFTVPGVLIGAQLGSLISSKIPQKMLVRMIGSLFLLVALITFADVIVPR